MYWVHSHMSANVFPMATNGSLSGFFWFSFFNWIIDSYLLKRLKKSKNLLLKKNCKLHIIFFFNLKKHLSSLWPRIFLLLFCRDMIATGCEDKNVRVYYLATSSDQPLKVFTGHTAKVFHVRWSPLREGILCSGSDDGWVFLNNLKT